MGDLADEYNWADYIAPEEIDDVNPDESGTAHDFFQHMVDKLATYEPPKGIGYVFAMDPSNPHHKHVHVALRTDSASQRMLNLDKLRVLFPWAQYPTPDVPQINNNPKEKYTMDMSGIAKMRGELEEMLAKFTSMVAIVERFGGEPGEGTVIKFEHTFRNGFEGDDKVYDYAAVRKFGKWYVTGRPFAGHAVSWSKLLDFIGDGRAWICREFEEVPVPGAAAESETDKAAAVANLLANAGGRDTAEVAAEVVALLKSK